MPRLEPTTDLIAAVLQRIPEGFLRNDLLCQRIRLDRTNSDQMVGETVGRDGEYWYDRTRLTQDVLREMLMWARPVYPETSGQGKFTTDTIAEEIAAREHHFADEPAQPIWALLAKTPGYALPEELAPSPDLNTLLDELIAAGDLRRSENIIYDPLRISIRSARLIAARTRLTPAREELIAFLQQQPGQTARQDDLYTRFGKPVMNEILESDEFRLFHMKSSASSRPTTWIRMSDSDAAAAQQAAETALSGSWETALQKSGDVVRPGAKDGKTARLRVLARTYTLNSAAQRLSIRQQTIERAIHEDRIAAFEDPEGRLRLPADTVEGALKNPEYAEYITAYESVRIHDLALVMGMNDVTIRRRLQKIGIHTLEPRWGQVRGQLDLPETFQEYRTLLNQMSEENRMERREQQRRLEEERLMERERRDELRARLTAAFPTWRHEGRADQQVTLHIGPPNSGKTHAALESLVSAGSGWYLAPLRLLAFEIFDRLNQRGILCNLLTGEEHIAIPGANITAATVEMFNAHDASQCVVIDEAQMLADADRGWAWTRALMEAEAPEIHIIGPQTVQGLIQRMADSADIPIQVVEHDRLTPIEIAERHWTLSEMPPRTILVAFSRQLVLQLKTELERMKRTVSVVYGNLPPEVRRKQADRFANGETEICVATDAVGMGLNLPADHVCFYEMEKYDGRNTRTLMPSEVQQIGGRAGRFGLSTAGLIGATSKRDLKVLRQLYYEPAAILTHARVAPTVEDLELIPGTLSDKLRQWSSLQSIPDSLRGAIQTADMSERIELASMLTEREVKLLGLEAALKLVNAPTRKDSRSYWYQCSRAILTDKSLPFPPVAPRQITNTIELDSIEYSVACADIYLWLSQRHEFSTFAPYATDVRQMRAEWSIQIDGALLRRINTMRRCTSCGSPLPLHHRFSICDNCYHGRTGYHNELDDR
jgi:hypothetical protein